MCQWRPRSLRFARRMTASLMASLLLRCKAPSVSLPRSSHDGVAHCVASLALQTACARRAVGPFTSLVTFRRLSFIRFSCVATGLCQWRRRSLRFACRMTASLFASLLLRCKHMCLWWRHRSLRFARRMTTSLIASRLLRRERRAPIAPSFLLSRSSHASVAHCFDCLALHTARACGAVGPVASLVA